MTDHDDLLDVVVRLGRTQGHHAVRIEVRGDFDVIQVPRFDSIVGGLVLDGAELTVDLCNVGLIDSAALGALVRLRRRVVERDGQLVTLVARPFQLTIMRISGLFDHLNVVDVDAESSTSVDEAGG